MARRRVIALPGALSGPSPLAAVLPVLFPGSDFDITVCDLLENVPDIEEGYAAWTNGFLARVPSPEPCLLFGYSMGARLAMHALRAAPHRWSGAILVSGHPGLTREDERAARREEDDAWSRRILADPWPDVLAAWEARPVFAPGISPENWHPGLAAIWSEDRRDLESRRQAIAGSLRAWSLGRQDDFRPFLAATNVPIHWVTGALDAKFTAIGRELASLCPMLRHAVVPGCGHRVPWENPSPAWCGGNFPLAPGKAR